MNHVELCFFQPLVVHSHYFHRSGGNMDVQESLRKAQERALRAKARVNGADKSGTEATYDMIIFQ